MTDEPRLTPAPQPEQPELWLGEQLWWPVPRCYCCDELIIEGECVYVLASMTVNTDGTDQSAGIAVHDDCYERSH